MLSLTKFVRKIAWDDGWLCLIPHEVFMDSLNTVLRTSKLNGLSSIKSL